MNALRLTGLIGLAALAVLCVCPPVFSQSAGARRDGQHDFDFDLGNWKPIHPGCCIH
jgi:hypothetical protein